MSSKYCFNFLILLLVSGFARSQDSTLQLKLTRQIAGKYSNFTTDKLGNIFLINTNNELIEYNNHYDSIAAYKKLSGGNLSLVDATNPLKILVYYNESNTIDLLDRQLNLINTISLSQNNIFKVNVMTKSYDNNYWLFDEWDNKIKKIDDNGTVLTESADFRLIFKDVNPPDKIIDDNGSLYLYQSGSGWLVFDYYLGLKKQYPYLNWKDVWVEDGILKGFEKGNITMAFPQQLIYQQLKTSIIFSKPIKIIYDRTSLLCLQKEGLMVYTIQ